MKVPVPDIDDQISFVKILNQADKSKFGDFKSQFIEMLFKKPITGKIGDLVDKKIFSVKKIHSMNDIIEYIDISSVERSNHSIVETTSYVVSNAPSRAQQCVRLDDILVSTVRPINRNIAVVNSDKNNLVASTGFCVLRPKLAFKEYLLAISPFHLLLQEVSYSFPSNDKLPKSFDYVNVVLQAKAIQIHNQLMYSNL